MSWQSYIINLLGNEGVEDAVIVGYDGKVGSVWGSCEDGWLKGLTQPEIKALWGEHSELFCSGVTLAGKKCTIVRDDKESNTLDLKMKTTDQDPHPLFITVGKSLKALVIVRGKKDVVGGKVNPCVFKMIEYLRKLGY